MHILQTGMACTIEKVLADARMLVNRLRDHDGQADNLISQAQALNKRVEAMKQYQEDLNELNEIARHRPRSALIMNLAQENTQIRELQAENRELKLALEEHQNAISLIMTKYREQIVKLMLANKLDSNTVSVDQSSVIEEKMDKICEMAAVMQKAVSIDDGLAVSDEQLLQQLRVENQTLRDLLHISNASQLRLVESADSETQTKSAAASNDEDHSDDGDTSTSELNVTVIEAAPSENATDKSPGKS